MAYELLIKKQAQKTLLGLSRNDRARITEKLMLLRADPDHGSLDIKPLQGEPYYRLRVGQ